MKTPIQTIETDLPIREGAVATLRAVAPYPTRLNASQWDYRAKSRPQPGNGDRDPDAETHISQAPSMTPYRWHGAEREQTHILAIDHTVVTPAIIAVSSQRIGAPFHIAQLTLHVPIIHLAAGRGWQMFVTDNPYAGLIASLAADPVFSPRASVGAANTYYTALPKNWIPMHAVMSPQGPFVSMAPAGECVYAAGRYITLALREDAVLGATPLAMFATVTVSLDD